MLKKNEKKKDWTESKLREQRSNTEQTWNPIWTFNLAKTQWANQNRKVYTRQLFRDSSGNAHNIRTCTYICLCKVFIW